MFVCYTSARPWFPFFSIFWPAFVLDNRCQINGTYFPIPVVGKGQSDCWAIWTHCHRSVNKVELRQLAVSNFGKRLKGQQNTSTHMGPQGNTSVLPFHQYNRQKLSFLNSGSTFRHHCLLCLLSELHGIETCPLHPDSFALKYFFYEYKNQSLVKWMYMIFFFYQLNFPTITFHLKW